MKRMNPRFYLGSMVAYIPIGGLFILISYLIEQVYWQSFSRSFLTIAVPLFLFAGVAVILYGKIIMLIIWYKSWKAIQDPSTDGADATGRPRATPGKAIGLMFIPLFNIIWAYQAFWGFAKDYNNYIEQSALDTPKLPSSLFLGISICCIMPYIPILGVVIVGAGLILFLQLIAFFMMVPRINSLIESRGTIQQASLSRSDINKSREQTNMTQRPTLITVVCIIAFVSFLLGVLAMPSIYGRLTATYGAWYGPVWIASLCLSVAALIGYWMMKRWGVYLYTAAFLGGTILGVVKGMPFTLLGVVVPIGVCAVGFLNLKKMD